VRSGRRGVQRYTYDGIEALARLKSVRTIPLVDPKAARDAARRRNME